MTDGKDKKAARRRSHTRQPVFLDPRHRRGRVLGVLAAVSALVAVVWLTTVAIGIYYIDILPENAKLELIRRGGLSGDAVAAPDPVPAAAECTGRAISPTDALPHASGERAAYLRAWPDWALPTLARQCAGFDRVQAEWLEIDVAAQTAHWLSEAGTDTALRDLQRVSPGLELELVALLPLPPVAAGGTSVLDRADVRARIAEALASNVAAGAYAGACVHPQQVEAGHIAGLRALLHAVKRALPTGVTLCVVADGDGALWRDADLVDAVDSVVLRAFREPAADAPPGPLAPQGWFESLMRDAGTAIGAGKLRVALGAFAYAWTEGAAEPVILSYAEAMRRISGHASRIELDAASLNTRAAFVDDAGRATEIWFLDAASLYNQLNTLARGRVAGVTLWPVGLEDPGAWPLFLHGVEAPQAAALSTVSFPDYVGYEGEGPFRRVAQPAVTGQRRFFRDPDTGLINGEIYDRVPRPVTMARYGSAGEKAVALTFDDGPDPEYTSEILDVLKSRGIPATFFVIGSNVVRHPDIVRRMVAEGHEVGSHTFLHPEDTAMGPDRAQLELNALQRLVASVTGRTTYLFRSPYGRSEGPLTEAEAARHLIVEREGYVVAGADIVPRDWEGMTAAGIADYVLDRSRGDDGRVIVLHDAGGDRSATVAAVPLVIDRLRAEGYRFVPLSDFLGLSRDEVMPVATDRFTPLDRASFVAAATVGRLMVSVFWGAVVFGVARSLLVLTLALLRRKHPARLPQPPAGVTVVIPAFNEELVVADAIAAALASDYPDIRVVVVDDGSTDGTAAAVERNYGGDPRVRLIRQENGGKCSALNAAYGVIDTGFVVALDADTLLHPDAVRRLMAHFADPAVGAVAGNVRVGNRRHLLARLQALEYVTAQNIDRRAAERLNAMLVVPGAIGAWRVEAVRKVGLYSSDTVTEDADLTIAILRAGYRVVFEERAYSITDAPETLRAFLKQRLRWSFGMMQTAWKHRRAARTARGVGLFSIPDLWVTGIALGLLAPVADAVFLSALVKAAAGLVQGQPPMNADASLAVIAGWAALPALDLIVALAAFAFERGERRSLLLLVPIQRLIYRPLLYITVYRAVGLALAGRIAGWGKLIRRGHVQMPVR